MSKDSDLMDFIESPFMVMGCLFYLLIIGAVVVFIIETVDYYKSPKCINCNIVVKTEYCPKCGNHMDEKTTYKNGFRKPNKDNIKKHLKEIDEITKK